MLYKTLIEELGLKTRVEKRISDSGAKILTENDAIELQPFGKDLWIAYNLALECGMPAFTSNDKKFLLPELKEGLDFNSLNDFIKEQPSASEKSFISLREIDCGKANSSNQLTTYAANSQLISLVNPVNPKRRSRSLLPTTSRR